MVIASVRLEGKDNLGVIFGSVIGNESFLGEVVVYTPKDNWTPSKRMTPKEFRDHVAGAPMVRIPYANLRQIFVEGKSIWEKKRCTDYDAESSSGHNSNYMGIGKIMLDLTSELSEMTPILERIMDSGVNLGLRYHNKSSLN